MTTVKPPADPGVRAFLDALGDAAAALVLAEIRAGRLAAPPDDDVRAREIPERDTTPGP